MKEFFLFETDYPAESGFALFGLAHILWLVFIGFVCLWGGKWFCMQPHDKQILAKKILGTLLPCMELYRDIVLFLTGHFDRGFLPVHLCSMALWIALFYAYTESELLGVLYLLLCVPGGLSALFFPDWNMYPFLNYMHLHAFFSHGAIVLFGVFIFFSDEIELTPYKIWIPIAFCLTVGPVVYWLNCRLGTNFWFINTPSLGSPLEIIYGFTGNKWYIFGYAAACFLFLYLWNEFLCRVQKYVKKRNS